MTRRPHLRAVNYSQVEAVGGNALACYQEPAASWPGPRTRIGTLKKTSMYFGLSRCRRRPQAHASDRPAAQFGLPDSYEPPASCRDGARSQAPRTASLASSSISACQSAAIEPVPRPKARPPRPPARTARSSPCAGCCKISGRRPNSIAGRRVWRARKLGREFVIACSWRRRTRLPKASRSRSSFLGGTEGRDRRTTQRQLVALRWRRRHRRPLMLLVGEIKEVAQARFGQKLVIKHLPDMPLMLPDDVHRRLKTRFATELELADAIPGAHLVAIATFGRGAAGIASVEEIALVATTKTLDCHRARLRGRTRRRPRPLRSPLRQGGLRYNLKRTDPLACVVLPWTRPRPTALHVVPDVDGAFASALDELIAASNLPACLWHAGAAMPRP